MHDSGTDRLVISYSDGFVIPRILELADRCGASVQFSEQMQLAFWTVWDESIMGDIASIAGVDEVERETPAHISLVPDDQYYSTNQWGLQKINASKAWDYVTGSKNITIAVLDTGVDYTHDDLIANMWKDANGYFGYDFWNDDHDPMDDNINGYEGTQWRPNLQIYHGTHVAGVAGAVMNNGIGTAGVAQVKIMAVKVMNDSGEGTDVTVAQGIQYAVDNGADIITMSLGVDASTTALRNAVEYAVDHRVVLTAAAGNEGASSVAYPAAYPEVIAVGAIDRYDTRASFSNHGIGLDIMAPGTGIYSTKPTDAYQYLDGTSTATPFVAGVAALMLSINPGLTPTEVGWNINNTAGRLGVSGWDSYTGWGVIDALAAVKAVSGPSTAIVDFPATVTENEVLTVKWVVTGTGSLNISQTYLKWGYKENAMDHVSASYSGFTPSTFSENNVTAPSDSNGTLYMQSFAVIDGTEHLSTVVHIKVGVPTGDPVTRLLNSIWSFIKEDIGLMKFIVLLVILIAVITAVVAVRHSRRRAYAESHPAHTENYSDAAGTLLQPAPIALQALPTDTPSVYVDISSRSFAPAVLEIEVGTRVIWRNTEWAPPPGVSLVSGYVDALGPHPSGIFASGLMISPGEYWSCVFNLQGVYPYYISNMNANGRIVVRQKTPSPAISGSASHP